VTAIGAGSTGGAALATRSLGGFPRGTVSVGHAFTAGAVADEAPTTGTSSGAALAMDLSSFDGAFATGTKSITIRCGFLGDGADVAAALTSLAGRAGVPRSTRGADVFAAAWEVLRLSLANAAANTAAMLRTAM
jgi:hypothetical protein